MRRSGTAPGRIWVANVLCWVPDRQRAFVEAKVVEVKGDKVVVAVDTPGEEHQETQREHPVSELLPRVSGHKCVADMDELEELNEATVLNNVEMLFFQKQTASPGSGGLNTIYSSVGPVLIAMNPFKELPIYGPEWVAAYHAAGTSAMARKRLGPHCYATAEEAYQGLQQVRYQSVVICGESGAGKTVTNRKMLEYLCEVGKEVQGPLAAVATAAPPASSNLLQVPGMLGRTRSETVGSFKVLRTRSRSHAGPEDPGGGSFVDPVVADTEQICEANVLLEAFGNAKTTRNNNSSRFGKFTQVHFDDHVYMVQGCEIEHYLLERSRVVSQPKHERNYHIFYQLTRSPQATKEYSLALDAGPEDFVYTSGGAAEDSFNDAADFAAVVQAMSKAGFALDARRSVFEAVAAVLHLGNITFTGDADTSEVSPKSATAVSEACRLLGIDADALKKGLTTSIYKVERQRILMRLGVQKAEAQRHAVAKMVYSRTFDRIVTNINSKLSRRRLIDQGSGVATVGLLDIFGFEDMLVNGFEQMLINLTNERIQYLFNSIMFERELEVYRQEGVANAFVQTPSNLGCIELFTKMKPPGILGLLSDQCRTRGEDGDGAAFVDVLNRNFKHSYVKYYKTCSPQDFREISKAKMEKSADRAEGRKGAAAAIRGMYTECFVVQHYAGTVMYTVQDFITKSRDTLLPHLAEMLGKSTKADIRQLFAAQLEASKDDHGSAKEPTVGEKFNKQLELLASKLERGSSLFVRCIKSNPAMVAGRVNRPLVMEQLVNGGVVAALEIRNKGFPDRIDFRSFCNEFDVIEAPGAVLLEVQTRCLSILRDFVGPSSADDPLYALGHTKVFMKGQVLPTLRSIKEVKLRHFANLVKRQWRIYMGTERIKQVEDSWERYKQAEDKACECGIQDLKPVSKVLRECEGLLGPVYQALLDARDEHGSERANKAVAAKIGAALQHHSGSLPKLFGVAENAATVVDSIAETKNLLDQSLAARLAGAEQQASALDSRVEAVVLECEGLEDVVDPAERDECLKTCRDAKDGLAELTTNVLPRLQEAGGLGVALELEMDLAKPPQPEVDLTPQVTSKLQDLAVLVKQAEDLGHLVARVRREFAKEVADRQAGIQASWAELKELKTESEEFIREGLNGIGDVFDAAWQEHDALEEILAAARNPQEYRERAVAFEAAVKEAKEKTEACRAWMERHKQEEQARLHSVLESLSNKQELRRSGGACIRALERAAKELDERLADMPPESQPYLASLGPRVEEKLVQDCRQLVKGLQALGFVVDEAVDLADVVVTERPQEGAGLGARANLGARLRQAQSPGGAYTRDLPVPESPGGASAEAQGAWSVSQSAALGSSSRDFARQRGLVKMLDQELITSITAAVDALNMGILHAREGCCIVYSQTRQQYYLLYREDKKKEALDIFDLQDD